MTTAGSKAGIQRSIALVLLVAAGIVSLPVVAAFLDGDSTEGLIIPVQLALMTGVGAAVGCLLPGVADAGWGRARSTAFGALVGVGAAVAGVVLFFLLLNGVSGA